MGLKKCGGRSSEGRETPYIWETSERVQIIYFDDENGKVIEPFTFAFDSNLGQNPHPPN